MNHRKYIEPTREYKIMNHRKYIQPTWECKIMNHREYIQPTREYKIMNHRTYIQPTREYKQPDVTANNDERKQKNGRHFNDYIECTQPEGNTHIHDKVYY